MRPNRSTETAGAIPPSWRLAMLLAVGLLLPLDGRLASLRGRPTIQGEVASANAAGYYEAILDAAPAGGHREGVAKVKVEERPPGWVLFVESGIIEPEPGYRRWRMRPGVDTVWNGQRFRTNRLGYRSPETTREKPPGTYRIAVLGSSNTMGHGVGDDAVYVRLFEDWLRAAVGPHGPRIELINLASSGEAPSQRLVRLREEVPPLAPDWVLWDASVVDPSLEEMHLEQMVRVGAEIPHEYVRRSLAAAGVSADDPAETTLRKLRGAAGPLLAGAYEELGRERRRLGIPIEVVLLPRADVETRSRTLRNLIRSLCEDNRLVVHDLFEAFRGRPLDQLRVAPWDNHPSVTGHFRIYEALREAIVGSGGPPGLTAWDSDRSRVSLNEPSDGSDGRR